MIPGQLEDRRAEASASELVRLTQKQAEVLSEITRYHDATGEPCRASYLARRLDMSRECVRGHVAALARKGWLRSTGSPFRLRRTV